MQNLKDKKIAIVCDWIKDFGGAELVLEQFLEIFPKADIFTSVFFQEKNPIFKWKNITTSFIQNIPFLNKSHKLALTLRPRAFESFDLSNYDIVISSTSAESKGVITKPETLQICYCHTPTRYFWSHYHEYLEMMEFGVLNFLWKWLMPKLVHKLRTWDFCAAQRPDYFLANSNNTASRIKKYYERNARVIYPCIDTKQFIFQEQKEDFYLYVGRCIPYKKFDLVVDAFNKNWKKIIIVTNTNNKLYKKLKNISKENIIWKLNISKTETRELFSQAKWFLFPPEEDFGLVPIEAMASGTPVIAYGKWWALETVIPPSNSPISKEGGQTPTWIFFEEQTVESLNTAIERFETMNFNPKAIREYAFNFDKIKFKENIVKYIKEKLEEKEEM